VIGSTSERQDALDGLGPYNSNHGDGFVHRYDLYGGQEGAELYLVAEVDVSGKDPIWYRRRDFV
jgi:hypothetical protein